VNAVPFPTEGKWDPGLTLINGRWHMVYVIALDLFSNFQPALARSPEDADHTEVRFVGADWSKRATEGPIIQKLGGEWRLFASCGDDEPEQFQNRYPIYFLRAANPNAPANLRPRDTNPERFEPPTAEEEVLRRLAFDGYLDAPHPTNIPHPQIVPISITVNGRRRTKYIMITFNGDHDVLRARPRLRHARRLLRHAGRPDGCWLGVQSKVELAGTQGGRDGEA
jgi:hypothetical protein